MPLFWRRSLIACFLTFTIALTIWAFWHPLSSGGMEWYLKKEIQKKLGSHFQAEQIIWSNGKIIFDNPKFLSSEPTSTQRFQAKQIAVSYDYSLWQRKISLRIFIDDPLFKMDSEAQTLLNSFVDSKTKKFKYFHLDWQISIPRGTLEQKNKVLLPFSLEASSDKGTQGQFSIQFNPLGSSEQSLVGHFISETRGTYTCDLNFNQTPLTNLKEGYSFFDGYLKELSIIEGHIDGHSTLTLKKKHPPAFSGELTLTNFHVTYPVLGFAAEISKAIISTHNQAENGNALLGKFTLHGHCSMKMGEHFQFKNITGEGILNEAEKIAFKFKGDGLYGKSPSKFIFKGEAIPTPSETLIGWKIAPEDLQIAAEFNSSDSKLTLRSDLNEDLIRLSIEGSPVYFSELFPESIGNSLRSHFDKKMLFANATMKVNSKPITVEADINVVEADNKRQHPLKIAFDIDKVDKTEPLLETPSRLAIINGRFEGEGLPLELFVEPFFFPDNNVKLSGEADFKGTFDESMLFAEYQAKKKIILESEDFRMEAESSLNEYDQPIDITGQHLFHFSGENDRGSIAINQGSYLDKRSQLLFTDLKTKIDFDKDQIHAKQIEGYCCDLYLAGALDVDYKNKLPGCYGITISAQTISGTATNLQRLLSHFNAFSFAHELPLEGNISLSKDPSLLVFNFSPKGVDIQSRLSGSLTEGKLDCSSEDFSLQDLAFDFDYDLKAKTLLLENLQGTAFIGNAEDAEEYTLSGNYIHASNLAKQQAEFDLSITNKTNEFLRLVGHTRLSPDKGSNESLLHVYFDNERTHINQTPLIRSELAFNPQFHVDHFHLEFALDLQKMANNLRDFSKTKIWHDIGLTKRSSEILGNSQGTFHIDLKYDQTSDQFFYSLKAADLTFDSHSVKKCLFTGKKHGSTWSIEQFQLDKFSMAADIVKENQKWIFNFLGLRWGPSFLVGLKGEYLADQHFFKGNINLLEVDLQTLNEIPRLQALFNKYNPKGALKGTGSLELTLENESSEWEMNALLNSSIHEPQLLGVNFEDVHHASWQLVSGPKLIVKQMILPFKSGTSGATPEPHEGFITIEKAEFDFNKRELSLDGAQFDIPVARLPWMTGLMRQHFPSAIDISIEEMIKNSKREDALQGRISVQLSSSEHSFRLELAQGKYWWLDAEHDVTNFALEKNSKLLKAVFKYRFEDQPFWAFLQAEGPKFTQGKILLSDELSGVTEPIDPSRTLTINWSNNSYEGFDIDKAVGAFGGLNVDLLKHPQRISTAQAIPLTGKVSFDVGRASNLLSPELRDHLRTWQINKEYTFTGQWELNKSDRARQGAFSFQGGISGQDIEFKGYEFEFLQGDCFYTHDNIRLSNIVLQDPAGFLQIDQIDGILRQKNHWEISIGDCEVTNWQPSLLRSIDNQPLSTNENMMIPQLKISQLQGTVGNPNSFTAIGQLSFDNRSRRTSHNPLIVIPTEIINRIGLDLSILTPVSGSIYFTIENGKVVLTKLKEVYSEGRISKFNLATNSMPSYMDFDGNLHLQIRMRHYNLLFKLAELFTFSVTGSIQKPVYSISKQPKKGLSLKRALKGI
jgi:hypothetical protein